MVVEEGRADQDTSARLDIPPRSRLLVIHRTRTADGRPVAFTTDLVPASRLTEPVSTPEALQRAIAAEGSLYRVLERAGIVVHHGVAEVKPARADRRLSTALEVPFGALLLEVDQVDATSDGDAILRSREWFRADAFRFQVYRKGSGGRL
jgi:GntR family transcriptional regulator